MLQISNVAVKVFVGVIVVCLQCSCAWSLTADLCELKKFFIIMTWPQSLSFLKAWVATLQPIGWLFT